MRIESDSTGMVYPGKTLPVPSKVDTPDALMEYQLYEPLGMFGFPADNGDVFVICQTTANATFLGLSDQSALLNYNGDDAVTLRKNGNIIDI